MIDISYSMDEIAGYEDGMDPADYLDNRVLTKRLDVAGAELGALTISLMWNEEDDLDLHVTNPKGDHIWYNQRTDRYTGELDVDMNAYDERTSEPVENVYWQEPPEGRYEIFVNNCDDKPVDYVVRVKQPGNMTFYRGRTDQRGKQSDQRRKGEKPRPRGPSHMINYPMHPEWNGGTRITNATNNALTIYDKFTTSDDHVGLIWFNNKFHYKMPLEVRVDPAGRAARGEGKKQRIESDQRAVLDSTRRAVKGGTAFFDALIKAVRNTPCSSNPYLVALTDGADSDSQASSEEAVLAIGKSPWAVFIIGLEVDPGTRITCELLANASEGGAYIHAADAGAGLDRAFAAVASQFVMPTVKSADAASSGGGVRGV